MTLHLMLDDITSDESEFRCDDCGKPLDQLGSYCVACAADRQAEFDYERGADR